MAAFQENTTEIIKSHLNIVDVVGSYIKLDKAGAHYKANCPFHQERSPSFMVNDERNMWHCFGCGKGGDIFAFVMEIEGLQFREALVLLAEKAGVELPQYRQESQGSKDTKERLVAIMELAVRFYEHQLWEGAGKIKALPYLRKRGLSDETIRKFRLGYAPDGWRHFREFAESKGYTVNELETVGMIIAKAETADGAPASLGKAYDRFRDRIMFPITDILGRPIGFSARVAPGGDESQAKYINTPESPLYHKSRALYGLSWAKQAMKQVGCTVVVEGNVDVIALSQAGIENVVAVSGTALTGEQLDIMRRYGKEVHLFFDMDGAGQKAARKSTELALEKELNVKLIALSHGKDAADMGAENPEELKRIVMAPVAAPQYFLEGIVAAHSRETGEGKRAIVDDFTQLLITIKNPLERSFWIKELARGAGLEERLVTGVVNQAFLEKTRRDGPEMTVPFQTTPKSSFASRKERIAEEVMALFLTQPVLRKEFLGSLDPEVKTFLAKQPLFFFVLQAGEHDPLSLIEDKELKGLATGLAFRLLDGPEFADLSEGEIAEKSRALLQEYLAILLEEVGKNEKLRTIEGALAEARKNNNKEEELRLLQEFVELSRS
ncbi:MAG: DNA primase [Candidatus Moranbacteria bacterium]|nr:DNA primase [Candidatus Moranbacteria bacterium]